MIPTLSNGFRAKLGHFWSLCNPMELSKHPYMGN